MGIHVYISRSNIFLENPRLKSLGKFDLLKTVERLQGVEEISSNTQVHNMEDNISIKDGSSTHDTTPITINMGTPNDEGNDKSTPELTGYEGGVAEFLQKFGELLEGD